MKTVYITLGLTLFLVLAALAWVNNDPHAPIIILILAFGALGGIAREMVSIRTNALQKPPVPLNLTFIYLSPLFGAVLAVILNALLLSGLVAGDIFPQFLNLKGSFESAAQVLRSGVTLATNRDFYLMIAWSLLAGYSEKFVVAKLDGLASVKPPATG